MNVDGSPRIAGNGNTNDGIAFPVSQKVDIFVDSLYGGPPVFESWLNQTYTVGPPSCYLLFPTNRR